MSVDRVRLARLCLGALIVAAVGLFSVAVASTSVDPLRPLAKRAFSSWVNDDRYAAYQPSVGHIVILDTQISRARRIASLCPLGLAGSGFALLDCTGLLPPRFRTGTTVLDLATGRTTPVAGLMPNESLDSIGSQWAQGAVVGGTIGSPTLTLVFVNWHTGRTVTEPLHGPPRDLNSAALKVLPFNRLPGAHSGSAYLIAGTLYAGSRRLRLCPDSCVGLDLSDGLVTWARGTTAYGYVLASGRHISWHVPLAADRPKVGGNFAVSHTANTVLFVVDDGVGSWNLYTARWR